MAAQRRGGLGRGLAALIPSSPEDGPQLGSSAADVIIGKGRSEHEETASPLPRSADGTDSADESIDDLIAATRQRKSGKKRKAEGTSRTGNVSRETSATQSSERGGLSAPDTELVDGGARYLEIPLDAIRPNDKQPRTVFDEDAETELVHSIREFGLMQPIVVRPDGEGRYELVMGERRWRASQKAGLTQIPAIVRSYGDDEMLRDALLENIHRVQLNPLEEANAYQQLLSEFGVTHEQLADRLGRSRPVVTNMIRLLRLPVPVQRRVAAGVLSAGHARALLSLTKGPEAQEDLAARIVAEGLSVRATEEAVTLLNNGDEPTRRRRTSPTPQSPELQELAGRFSDRYDTSVSVTMGKRKGKIVVEFGSTDDLQRIAQLMGIDPAGLPDTTV